ncbi:MAG: hypothetical protein EOP86_01635 [Verrucomicrobiaceae bacterium]|nr:MAG: hypothetical protein EOP86_01635 [Verrucomicrobiaceae bacterium]
MLYSGITAVFVLGGVAGGLLGVTAERDRVKKLERSGPGPMGELMGRRLEKELGLDPGQARHVRRIYATARPRVQQLDRERRQKLRAIMDEIHPQILEVLTPEQKDRFLNLQKKLMQRLRLTDPESGEPPPPDDRPRRRQGRSQDPEKAAL